MGKPKARGNGTGTAVKRGSTWEARVVIGWKPDKDGAKLIPIRRSKGGFAKKKDALAYCATLKQTADRQREAPTLEYYWKVYQKDLEQISADKQTAYKIAWNRMKSIWYRKVDSLTVAELRELVSSQTTTFYPAKDMKTVLKHLFKLAGADQWVTKDLPDYIILPKLQETEREVFTAEEQKKLWQSYESGNSDAAIPLIMIYTGMMTGEMKNLTTDMVHLDEKKIIGAGLKTKVRKESEIFLSSVIMPVVEELIRDKQGKIFDYEDTKFYKIYYAALEKAGVRKLSPYSCRHTTATALAIDGNIAPQTVQKIMRWSTSKMLDRYAHPDEEDVTVAIESIGLKQKASGSGAADKNMTSVDDII